MVSEGWVGGSCAFSSQRSDLHASSLFFCLCALKKRESSILEHFSGKGFQREGKGVESGSLHERKFCRLEQVVSVGDGRRSVELERRARVVESESNAKRRAKKGHAPISRLATTRRA